MSLLGPPPHSSQSKATPPTEGRQDQHAPLVSRGECSGYGDPTGSRTHRGCAGARRLSPLPLCFPSWLPHRRLGGVVLCLSVGPPGGLGPPESSGFLSGLPHSSLKWPILCAPGNSSTPHLPAKKCKTSPTSPLPSGPSDVTGAGL